MDIETDLQKIRETIANRCVNHIDECHSENLVMYLVIGSFPGSGKTSTVMMTIDRVGYTWLYLSPTHFVIKENLEWSKLRDYYFVHLKGKDQDGMCLAPEYIEMLKKGINITPFCETRCPFRRDGCPYYELREQIESYPQSWAGVHAHIPTYLQTFLYQTFYKDTQMFKLYDVLILDEFPMQDLYNQEIVQREDIRYLRKIIKRMPETDEKCFVVDFLSFLLDYDIDYSRLAGLIMTRRNLDLSTFVKEYDTTLLRLIGNKEIAKIPENILYSIMKIYNDNPLVKKLKWMIYEIKEDYWVQKGIYLTTSNTQYFKNIKIPIVCLDATADIKAWNTLLNDNCRYEKIDMEYKNIYQLSGGNYPVSSWVDTFDNEKLSSTGERLCDLIIEICKRKENAALVCSNKRIKKLIRSYLKKNYKGKNYKFAIFYSLRGKNEFYENCDTCIVAHEPNIPEFQLDILENVIGWDRKLLKELMTDSEIKQAIGRIRQNILLTPTGRIREKIEIFVFPGGKSEDDKIVEEAEIIPYEFIYKGDLVSLGDKIKEIIKRSKSPISKTKLYDVLSTYKISRITVDKELVKLYKNKYITNYKRSISWDFEEEKIREQIRYKRSSDVI